MGKWDGYFDINEEDGGIASWEDEDDDMEYYADVHGYEDEEPESVELTDTEVIARLKDALSAANASIAELGDKLHTAKIDADGLRLRIAELEAQLAKPATIHEVIDDFGETVTAVTL